MAVRLTKAEKNRRIEEVFDLLLIATPRRAIIQYGRENAWNVSDRTIDKYIQLATDRLYEKSELRIEAKKNRYIKRMENLYYAALVSGEFPTAFRAAKELAEFEGLSTDEHGADGTLADLVEKVYLDEN